MNKLLIISAMMFTILSGWSNAVRVNDNITSKLSLFPLVVENPSGTGPQVWVVWTDNRQGSYETYVNGLKSDGSRWWSGDAAVSIYTGASHNGHRLSPAACKGSSGDVFVAFINHHDNGEYSPGIYVQRAKPDSTFWGSGTQNGPRPIKISSSTDPVSLCSDGAGGVICAWMEPATDKNNYHYYVKATRLLSNGTPFWTDTIASVTSPHWLGNPQVAVVDTFVVVVYDEWAGSSSYLKVARRNKNTGSYQGDPVIIRSVSNPDNMYWDFLDYPLSVYGQFLYISEWTARRIVSQGEYSYYHADTLQIKLHKFNVTNNNKLWSSDIASSNYPYNGGDIYKTYASIENFPLRAPVITARSDGGAAVVYTTAGSFDYSHVDNRNWSLVIKYANSSGTITTIPYPSSGIVHTPDVIPAGGDSCIITYSSYAGGATVKTVMVNSTGKVWGDSLDGSSTYSCSPRLIKSNTSHFIIVWSEIMSRGV